LWWILQVVGLDQGKAAKEEEKEQSDSGALGGSIKSSPGSGESPSSIAAASHAADHQQETKASLSEDAKRRSGMWWRRLWTEVIVLNLTFDPYILGLSAFPSRCIAKIACSGNEGEYKASPRVTGGFRLLKAIALYVKSVSFLYLDILKARST
jgi:hypothetical protein